MICLRRPLLLAIPAVLLLAGCAVPAERAADPAPAPASASPSPTPSADPEVPLAAALGASTVPAGCAELVPQTTARLGAELRALTTLGVIGVSALHAGLLECFFPAGDGESVSVNVLPEPTPVFLDVVSGNDSVAIEGGRMVASCWGGGEAARTCDATMVVGDYAAEVVVNRTDGSTFSAVDVRDQAATELAATLAALPEPLAPAQPEGASALPAACGALDLSGTPEAQSVPVLASPAREAPEGSGDGGRLFFIAIERGGHLHCLWGLDGVRGDGVNLEAVPGAAWGLEVAWRLEAAGVDGDEVDVQGAERALGVLISPDAYRLLASVGADLLLVTVYDPALTADELRASSVLVLEALITSARS